MNDPQTIVAQSGHKQLQELQAVLQRDAIDSEIVCPPGANNNH